MAKDDQIKAIEAANGVQLVEDNYTAKQLTELQKLAEEGKAENRTAFDAKVKEFDDAREAAEREVAAKTPAAKAATAPPARKSGEKMITVKVSAAIAELGGEFTDPDSKATIGKDAVSVPHTAFVKEKIRSEEIVEAE